MAESIPHEIWDKIFLYAVAGEKSSDAAKTLISCRLVCKDWAVMIKKFVWQSPTKKWGVLTEAMIEKTLSSGFWLSDKMISHINSLGKRDMKICKLNLKKLFFLFYEDSRDILPPGVMERMVQRVHQLNWDNPCLEDMTYIAVLAQNGLITQLNKELFLRDRSLTTVTTPHLTSLIACVAEYVHIYNLSDCLDTILDSVNCLQLSISRQILSSDETKALVQAMESRLERVRLGIGIYGTGNVTIDIDVLTKYSGRGKCKTLVCDEDLMARYNKEIRTWATRKGWRIFKFLGNNVELHR